MHHCTVQYMLQGVYLPSYSSHSNRLSGSERSGCDHNRRTRAAFSAGRHSANAFAQVPVDQSSEQSFNRDSKGKGGIIGFSLKPCTVQRRIVTAHERAAIAQVGRQMAGVDREIDHH